MMKRLKPLILALAALFAGVGAALPAAAQVEVNVNRGDVQPLPIAIAAFGGERGADIAGVISANLERSGLFRPLDPATFTEKDLNAAVQPQFEAWKQIQAQALVNGQVTVEGGRLRVDFRLWDVYREQQLLGLQFTSTPENWRRVAHKMLRRRLRAF
jgi:TolB protein